MKDIKLDIKIPPVVGYLHHAYFLSVLQNHPLFREWFSSNYIQLRYNPKTRWLNFYGVEFLYDINPLLDVQIIRGDIIEKNKIDLIEFAANYLERGYYIYIFLDHYYIPNSKSYKRHSTRECLFYGFNNDKRCFYMAGFNAQSQYSFFELDFSDFMLAYENADGNDQIKMLKCKDNASYKFDIINVKTFLEDYAGSHNTSYRFRMFSYPAPDFSYGIEIYKHLKDFFDNPQNREAFSDLRPMHILWEHKKCMVSRIEYFSTFVDGMEYFYSSYKDIERKAYVLRNLQLKYTYTNDDNYIKNMIPILDDLYNEEGRIVSELLNCL